MNDPSTQGARASLTQSVRRFRRVARLAAADPLRLLPPDPLARLVLLSAPITALIDAAPLERLREAVGAPPSAPRGNAARTRLQQFAGDDAAIRTTPAAVETAPLSHQVAARSGNPAAAARQVRSSPSAGHLQPASEPPGRGLAPTATLAERRAALRRGNTGTDSRSRSAASALAHAESRALVSPTPSNEPFLVDRGDAPATPNAPLAACDMRRADHEPLLTDEREAAPQHNDDALAPAELAPAAMPLVDGTAQSTGHSARGDLESAATSEGRSPYLPGLSPEVARTMPQADQNTGGRRRVPQRTTESELADALFETLYRDGVDVSWP